MLRRSKLLGLVMVLLVGLPTLAVSAEGRPANHMSQVMLTHASQGPVTVVDGSVAKLRANDQGITAQVRTHGLVSGNVHTFWIAIVNRPDLCETSPCGPPDVLGRPEVVETNVVYGGGRVVRSHTTPFSAHVAAGEIEGGWFDNAFTNPRTAEIHVIINDHGPMIPGMVREMATTYRGGCTDESIPPAFPETAFANGTPGPNTCRLVQFSIFVQQ